MGRDAGDAVPPRRPKPTSRAAGDPDEPSERNPHTTWRPATSSANTDADAGLGAGKSAGKGAGKAADRPKSKAGRADREPTPASGGPTFIERIVFGSVSTAHLATFCRQFAAYMDAGVDLMRALTSLQSQFARTALGPVIARMQLAVRRGEALGDCMSREPQAFDPLFLSLMRVAEARGGVPETLRLMAKHYEARLRLYRQARSAMIYPVIVLLVASAVVALLTIFVLPIFISFLNDMVRGGAANLPLPTRFLMGFSHFMQSFGWWLVPVVLVGGFVFLVRFYKTAGGKRMLDEAALYVPVLGKLLRLIDTTRFARTLAALLEGGVDIGSSLDLTASVVRLAPYRRALEGVRTAVMDGSELSEALQVTGRFGPDVVAIVNSGEETGKLPESLEHLADDYEEQVTYMVKNLGHLVQPLLVLFMGGIVLFIILAVFLPYIMAITSITR